MGHSPHRQKRRGRRAATQLSPATSQLICLHLVRTSPAPCSAIIGIMNSSSGSLARGQGVLQLRTHGGDTAESCGEAIWLVAGARHWCQWPFRARRLRPLALVHTSIPRPRGLHLTRHLGACQGLTAVSLQPSALPGGAGPALSLGEKSGCTPLFQLLHALDSAK